MAKDFVRFSYVVLLFAALAFNQEAFSVETCGGATVIAGGDSCETLAVKFDLSGCNDTPAGSPIGSVKCDKESGVATLKTANATYRTDVKPSTDPFGKSTWAPVGKVRKYAAGEADETAKPKAEAPKKPKKEKKPKEKPVQTAVVTPVVPAAPAAKAVPVAPAAVAVPQPAPAAPQLLSVKGHFRSRIESADFTDYSSKKAFITARLRPMFTLTPGSDVSVHFEPQFARVMGEKTPVIDNAKLTATAPESSGNTLDPSLGVHQAYADYHPADWFKIMAGRQVLSYGNELVIGALDWNNVGRSFDAIKTKFTYDSGSTDVFVSKLAENSGATSPGNAVTPVSTTRDKDFYGIYNSWSVSPWVKTLDLYALFHADFGTAGALYATGFRMQSAVDAFDYRAEVTKELGKAVKNQATQAAMEGGYTFDHSMKPRLGLEAFYASENYNQLFPTAHKWLGYADIFARKNILGFVVHGSAKMLDGLTTELDFHNFARATTSSGAFKITGAEIAKTSTSKSLGSEIDLTLKYAASKAVMLVAGASIFMQGQYFKDMFGDKTPTFAFTQMEVKF